MSLYHTELWSKGRLFRTFTLGESNVGGLVSVRVASGKADMDVPEAVQRFGLREAIVVLSGYGRERWFWDISEEEARGKLETFRSSAEGAGFDNEGKAEI